MAEENVKPAGPTYIHGIGSSTAIDTSSEIVDLAGLDCSSLVGGPFSWEHKNDQPNQLVGKILEYKKIFSEKDCEKDEHRYFWDKCKVPYLYVMGRLFDDKKDSSRECAALFLDDAEHPDEHPMVGFSVEGSKISKVGMVVDKSIARRITVTNCPANKTCVAEMVKNPDLKQESDTDSIFKSEPSHTIELFTKAEPLNKAITGHEKGVHLPTLANPGQSVMGSHVRKPSDRGTGSKEMARRHVGVVQRDMKNIKPKLGKAEVPGSNLPSAHPAQGPSKAVKGAPGWSHTGGGNFHHPEHGIVSVVKQGPEFHVKHRGALAGVGGKKGVFGSSKEAGGHAGDYMRSLSQGKTVAPSMHERPSPQMKSELRKDQFGYPGTATGSMAQTPPEPNKAAATGVSAGVNAGDVSMGQAWSNIKSGLGFGKKEKSKKPLDKSLTGRTSGMGGRMGMMGGGLPQESTDKKNKRGLFNPDVDKITTRGTMMGGGMGMARSESKGNLKKAMTAGSGMAAPGNLSGGAALAPESLDRKMKKSEWLARAEQAYAHWEKREQFENFMAKHLPSLTKGEIKSIGQTLALRKSLRAEKRLAGMVDQGQDSWVKKKEK